MKRIAGIVFGLLMLPAAAAAQEFKAGGITVVAPWARATPGGAKVGGAYLELKARRVRAIASCRPAARLRGRWKFTSISTRAA